MTPDSSKDLGGRYRLLSRLGAGGMGVVHRALDRLTGREVALKQVTDFALRTAATRFTRLDSEEAAPSEAETVDLEDLDETAVIGEDSRTSSSGQALLQLAQEFQVLSSLRHPNIISVLDYGFSSEGPYYTMTLLKKPLTLLEAARGRPVEFRLELLVQVLRALSYLHRRGIIHRDLKPGNVLAERGTAYVLDFGLAMKQGQQSGLLAGTPTHMAPEVIRGKPPGRAADLYAVGVMAYELLAGAHPFEGATHQQALFHHLNTEPDFSRLKASEKLVRVVRRLLAKDEGRRWQKADAVIAALNRASNINVPLETQATRESFLQAAEFVDREEQKRLLVEALKDAISGNGGLWLVEAESGLGKSRLLDELRTLALVRGISVVEGQAAKHRRSYHIFEDPLRTLTLNIDLSDEEGSILKILVPDLERLLERELPDHEVNPQTAQQELFSVAGEVLARQKQPVLMILEDLHLADESLDLLREFSPALAQQPILIVGSYRIEEAPRLAESLPLANRLRLTPLQTDDIASLTRSMLGHELDHTKLIKFLEKQTEGNVFFIVEAVRALGEEAGELSKVAQTALPEQLFAKGIETVVQRRLGLVPDEHQPFLQWAAVLGREPDVEILRLLLGPPETDAGLSVCADLALLEVRGDAWRFSHDKFREALIQRMSPAVSRQYHREAGQAIERVHGETEETAPQLAYHFMKAGDLVKEAHYSAVAGKAALKRGAYREATELLQRALELQPQLGQADPDSELDILLHLGSVLIATRGWSALEVKQIYDRAAELGKLTGRQSEVAPALIGLSKFFFISGRLSTSRKLAKQCLELADATGDAIIRQHGRLMVGETGVWCGKFAEDRYYAEEIRSQYDPEQASVHLSLYGQDPWLTSMVSSTIGTWMLGYPQLALERSVETMAFAEEDGNPFARAIAYQVRAWLHQLCGDDLKTLAESAELAAISEEHGFPAFAVLAQALQGWGKARTKRSEAGLKEIRQAVATWTGLGAKLATTYYATLQVDACLQLGLTEEGLSVITELQHDPDRSEECAYDAELKRLEGELLRLRGRGSEAREAFVSALQIAAAQQARSFELRAAVSYARQCRRTDQAPQARRRLEQLCEWFSDKGETRDQTTARDALSSLREEQLPGEPQGD